MAATAESKEALAEFKDTLYEEPQAPPGWSEHWSELRAWFIEHPEERGVPLSFCKAICLACDKLNSTHPFSKCSGRNAQLETRLISVQVQNCFYSLVC